MQETSYTASKILTKITKTYYQNILVNTAYQDSREDFFTKIPNKIPTKTSNLDSYKILLRLGNS